MRKVEFNYDAVVAQHRAIAKEAADKIRELLRSSARSIVEIGKVLLQVHSVLRDEHYHAWLKSELGWNYTNAWHYESCAKRFGEIGDAALDCFQPSALRVLSQNSANANAVEESIRLACKGAPVSRQVALKLIRKHCPAARSQSAFREPIYQFRRSIKRLLSMEMTADDRRALADELISLASQLRGNKPVRVGRQAAIEADDDTGSDATPPRSTTRARRPAAPPVPA